MNLPKVIEFSKGGLACCYEVHQPPKGKRVGKRIDRSLEYENAGTS